MSALLNIISFCVNRSETGISAKRQSSVDDSPELSKRFKTRKLATQQPNNFNDFNTYSSLQKDEEERILNNRPKHDIDIPPLPLLYRGFGIFSDSIKSGTISDSIKGDVDKLVQASCDISSEEAKKKATEDLLHRILFPDGVPFRYRIKDPSQRATDGHILTAANGGPLFIVEYKREIAAAEAQLAAYFMQLVGSAHEALSQTLRGWRQPALGLAIRGRCQMPLFTLQVSLTQALYQGNISRSLVFLCLTRKSECFPSRLHFIATSVHQKVMRLSMRRSAPPKTF